MKEVAHLPKECRSPSPELWYHVFPGLPDPSSASSGPGSSLQACLLGEGREAGYIAGTEPSDGNPSPAQRSGGAGRGGGGAP